MITAKATMHGQPLAVATTEVNFAGLLRAMVGVGVVAEVREPLKPKK